jgi:hypothetical protein
MVTRTEVDQKYISQAKTLEAEFFDIIDEGKPTQHRVLKPSKSIDEFDRKHGEIWSNHEAELLAVGLIKPPPIIPEPRDVKAELDSLKAWAKTQGYKEKETKP